MQNKVFIYALSGDDGVIRYIGKSVRPFIRFKEHIYESKSNRTNYHKNNWIKKLLKNNEDLHISILEECDENNWKEREIYWISMFSNLTNITPGGESGGYHIKYSIPIDEFIIWVKTNIPHINSETKWREYIKNNNIPDFIPKRPDEKYRNNGWVSFGYHFNKVEFISFIDLKKLVKINEITTYREYKLFRNKNMPYNPQSFYKDDWISWYDFFDKEKPKKLIPKKIKYLSYSEAKKYIKNFLFTKKIEYTNWYLNNKNIGLPRDPIFFYKYEFISWEDFFGNNLPKIINYSGGKKWEIFFDYYDAKKWVNENISARNEKDWRKISNTLPYFIPRRPDARYKNYGWVSYSIFLNIQDNSKSE